MSDSLELGHHIVYYTFWPMLLLTFGGILLSPVLWLLDYVTLKTAFLLPWAYVLFASAYLMLLGDYVIPSETYRKVRAGEWEYND